MTKKIQNETTCSLELRSPRGHGVFVQALLPWGPKLTLQGPSLRKDVTGKAPQTPAPEGSEELPRLPGRQGISGMTQQVSYYARATSVPPGAKPGAYKRPQLQNLICQRPQG